MTKDRREDRHTTDRHVVSIGDDDWDELGRVVGDRQRSDVLRRLVRGFLKRPGARMPRRGDYERDAVTEP